MSSNTPEDINSGGTPATATTDSSPDTLDVVPLARKHAREYHSMVQTERARRTREEDNLRVYGRKELPWYML